MNLWTRKIDGESSGKPLLIMEDNIEFVRSKEEALEIVEKTFDFLLNHPEIEWDLLYPSYRDIEATRAYEVSTNPPIHLWQVSRVISNTAFIVNKNPQTTEKLNKCYLTQLDTVDKSISYCLKHRFIRGYLIEPKLAQAMPGFSSVFNSFEDNKENDYHKDMLGNHTKAAKFHGP